MENTKLLYNQYKYEKEATVKNEIEFDMVKRLEEYRRNVNLYNSLRTVGSDKSISSDKEIPIEHR